MEYHQDQWANIVTWGLLQIWWCRQTDRQSYSIIRINQQKYTYIGFGEEMMFYTCPDKKGKSIERKNHLLHKRINIEEKTEEAFILFPKLKWQEQKQILKPSKNMWIFLAICHICEILRQQASRLFLGNKVPSRNFPRSPLFVL